MKTTTANNTRIERIAGSTNPTAYLVKADGRIVGMLEKYANTRYETHPWKAVSGAGMTRTFLGAFYGPHGRARAIAAVLANPGVFTAP